jgi:hypothetical protein
MKTLDNTQQNASSIRERIRIGLTLAGIVTAIICSMALLFEAQASEKESDISQFVETPKVMVADLSMKITDMAVTAIWPF